MITNGSCKVFVDGYWVQVPAKITIRTRETTCDIEVKGSIDCLIPEEYFYTKWAEMVEFKESLRGETDKQGVQGIEKIER